LSRKVIVTIAPTGGMGKKEHNANLPTQPPEIAEDVAKCCKAGASIAALHARRPDGQATCNPEIYRDINARVRAKCDIIVNNSTGGGIDGDINIILEAGAEMATFDGFTVAASHAGEDVIVPTSPKMCDRMAERFKEVGIKPEWEVFNPAHILQDVTRLIKAGYDKPPYYINIVLGTERGFQGGMPYSVDILSNMISLLPPDSIFCVSAVGSAQLPATTQALLMGGHVRVGLEDNLMYARGVPASNLALVERQVRIIRELGMEPATPAEARDMLGLAPV
jgi:3-keto-5-aminohexanoate cleavage enzyme